MGEMIAVLFCIEIPQLSQHIDCYSVQVISRLLKRFCSQVKYHLVHEDLVAKYFWMLALNDAFSSYISANSIYTGRLSLSVT